MPESIASQSAPKALAAIIRTRQSRLVAIDGMAASGKTTLAAQLASLIPGSAVVHMDDFFWPADKRCLRETVQANADIGRFDAEVLTPLCEGRAAVYRPFQCHPQQKFLPPVVLEPGIRVVIVEGAYCLHAQLFERYDLRVLSLIDGETQKQRIAARNGEAMLSRFLNQWIPMENRHIDAQRLKERCDVIITTA